MFRAYLGPSSGGTTVCIQKRKTNLMHNLFSIYFVKLDMFRPYLGPSSRGRNYVYKNWYLLFFLDDCCPGWIPIQYTENKSCIKLGFLHTITLFATLKHYLLTPWSRVLLEKLTGSAASQEIPRIYGTRKFLTVPTSDRHPSLS